MKRAAIVVLVALALGLSVGVTAETIDDDVALAEVAAYIQTRAAFQRHCFRCHTSDGGHKRALERLDMSRYPFVGKRAADAGRAVRRAVGGAGAKATMPKDEPGSVTGEDLASITHWTDTFDALHPEVK
jgi:mono/diheme cytochrome c family protein